MLSPLKGGQHGRGGRRKGTPHKGGTTCGVPHVIPLMRVVPPTVWCLPGGWDNMWCPPHHPPSPASSPLQCGVSQEGGTTCGVPRVISPHPRHPPSSVVSPRRVGQHVVSPVSSPLAHVIPPSVWCLPGGWDNMWYPPCRPPSPASSPLQCGVSQEGGTTCGVPLVIPPHPRRPPSSVMSPRRVGQHVVSPVSSPLARVVLPPVWCLPGGWDNMWCPPCHPPSPTSSPLQCGVSQEGGTTCGIPRVVPLTRVIPPLVWCLPGGWDNMWYPPCRPPSPASSPLQCGVSQEGGTTCGVPCIVPPCPCRPPLPVSSPLARVVPP